MSSSNLPFHTLNTLPAAEAAGLADTRSRSYVARVFPAQQTAPAMTYGPHQRLFPDGALDVAELMRPFQFRDLPGRMDGGVDGSWGRGSHRVRSICRSWSVDRAIRRRNREALADAVSRQNVNGGMKVLVWTMVVEAALAGLVIAGVLLRKGH